MNEKKPPNGKESKSKKPPTSAVNDPILANRYYADIHDISVSLATIATVTPAEKLLYADIHSIAEALDGIDESLESIDKSLASINVNTAAGAVALESINESLQANNTKLLLILAQIAECICGSTVNAQFSTLTLKAGDKSE